MTETWLPIESAPRNVPIIGRLAGGAEIEIHWSRSGVYGSVAEGWYDESGRIVLDEVVSWRPLL